MRVRSPLAVRFLPLFDSGSVFTNPDMQKIFDEKFLARFWSNVCRGDAPDDCWLWLGGKWRKGYGRIKPTGSRRFRSAHRISYEMHIGPLDGRMVLHSCDNPRCVNPNHLSLGTALDNSNDARARGRTACGERAFGAKLTGDSVKFIRWLLSEGAVRADVARQFKTTPGNISLIRDRINWRHVP